MPKDPEKSTTSKKTDPGKRKKKVDDNTPGDPDAVIETGGKDIEEAANQSGKAEEIEIENAVLPEADSESTDSETIRTLQRQNKELLVQIRELELEHTRSYPKT